MEYSNCFTIGLAACGAAIVVVIWGVLNWVWLRPKKLERCLRRQGLTGKSYRLFDGDMKESSMMVKEARSRPMTTLSNDIVPRVFPSLHKSIATYGKNSFMWLGPKPRVNIMDPELVKEILSKNSNFKIPKITNPAFKFFLTGLSSYDGERWAKHRKIINPAFHLEKLKHMLPAFDKSCCEMMSKWEKMVCIEGGGSSGEIDVWPFLKTMSSDIISRTAFGSSYEEGKRIFQLQTEQADHAIQVQTFTKVYIPGWRFVPTKRNKRMKEIDNEIKASLRAMIDKRLKVLKAEAGATPSEDLLGILLESNLREIQDNGNSKEGGMSIMEVIEECKLFYIAGQETTSVLLVWTMVLLSKHQTWQQRAREEVLLVVGRDKPNFDSLNHLKVVTMILYEVLRLYPPAPLLTRTIHEDTRLRNLYLPAGVLLCLPIIQLNHDPEIWGDDANEFNPERFSEGLSKATKNQSLSFFPFGWGPRICIGQNFAMLKAKMALAMILQCFSFELSPSYAHAPVTGLALKPQYGAHLMIHKL